MEQPKLRTCACCSEDCHEKSRQLETELAEARAEIAELKQEKADDAAKLAHYIAKMALDVSERDRLIEQMREAL